MANAWIIRPEPISAAGGSTTALGLPINMANDYAGIVWRTTGTANAWTVDMGRDVAWDTVLMFGLDLAPAGNTIYVSGRTDAQGPTFGADDGFAAGGLPVYAGANRLVNGKGVGLFTATAPAACRYFKFQSFFMGTGAFFEIGRLVIGKRIVLARNFEFGGAFGIRDFGSLDFSSRGVMLRRRARRLRTVGISFPSAYRDEVEAAVLPLLEKVGTTDPVALVTNPDADPMRERRCYFGPLVGDLGVVQRNAVGWRAQCNLVSLF